VAGIFWANDRSHQVAKFIRQNSYRLRIDVNLREVIGSLFD
jgi:Leu/Phe-tRNA-protein transferase